MRDFWIFLFVLGLVLFTWPVITIFQTNLAKYLFIIWFVLIVVIYVVNYFMEKNKSGG
jgi:hypothetical protein